MRFLFIVFLFSNLLGCAKFYDWQSQITAYSVGLTSSLSSIHFSQKDEEKLLILFRNIDNRKTCASLNNEIDRNKTIISLVNIAGLKKGFLQAELYKWDNNWVNFLASSVNDPKSAASLSVVSVWQKHFTNTEVSLLLDKIKYCKP